jgi:NADH-quinone oxidoreductase subunit C
MSSMKPERQIGPSLAGASDTPPAVTALLQQTFAGAVKGWHKQHGDETVVIGRERMLDVFKFLRDDARCQFNMMIDLTATDDLDRTPRFEVVVHLKSIPLKHRLRVRIPVDAATPEVDTISFLWVAADWYERECYDMYGIIFKGHPYLKRLLMWEGFEGYPLRKDYEKGHVQPLVPLRPVKERYDYGERYDPVRPRIHN